MKTRFFLAALSLFLGFSSFAYARVDYVRALTFEGNIRTPDETIASTITTRVGSLYNRELIRRDIKALYKLGQFRDIEVDRVPHDDGVQITFRFVEHPLITDIRFSGNRKIKSETLREEISVRTYRPVDEENVAESLQAIRDAYAEKGYYLAEVDFHIETNEKGEAIFVFDITENKGAMVRRVFFMGNEAFSDDELRDVIRTKQKGPFAFLTGTGKYEEERLRIDQAMLTYHYLNHGYLKVKVSPPKVAISKDKRYMFVTIAVEEGKQYRIDGVELSGDILTTREELIALLTTKPKLIYSQKRLEEDIQALTERYGDEGYAFATIVPRTVPNDETLTAKVTINVEKGKRITIERIDITGNTKTRDKVIRRELKVVENARYSERDLRESRKRLMQLGYFEEVNLATPRGSRDDTVLLTINVKEKPTGTFNIGAAYSTFDQFIFNMSITKENFFGYGISGQVSMELSSRRQFFRLAGHDPYFLDTRWRVGFSLYRNAFLFDDFRRTAEGGTISVGRPFFEYWTADVGYQLEDVSISSFSTAVPQFFRQNSGGVTSAMSLSIARDTRDNRLIPTDGMYHLLSFEVSGDKLGGDNDFFRTNHRSQIYHPIWKGIVAKAFGRVGHIQSLNDSQVPLFERFILGGPNSLRGYNPNAVGPSLRIPASTTGPERTFTFGGDKMLLFVTELELPIYRPAGFMAVAFYDAGNAFAENENYSFANMRQDYGFGLRWNSPMGPLRFEWGFPIDKRSDEDDFVFNFSIGQFF